MKTHLIENKQIKQNKPYYKNTKIAFLGKTKRAKLTNNYPFIIKTMNKQTFLNTIFTIIQKR